MRTTEPSLVRGQFQHVETCECGQNITFAAYNDNEYFNQEFRVDCQCGRSYGFKLVRKVVLEVEQYHTKTFAR